MSADNRSCATCRHADFSQGSYGTGVCAFHIPDHMSANLPACTSLDKHPIHVAFGSLCTTWKAKPTARRLRDER